MTEARACVTPFAYQILAKRYENAEEFRVCERTPKRSQPKAKQTFTVQFESTSNEAGVLLDVDYDSVGNITNFGWVSAHDFGAHLGMDDAPPSDSEACLAPVTESTVTLWFGETVEEITHMLCTCQAHVAWGIPCVHQCKVLRFLQIRQFPADAFAAKWGVMTQELREATLRHLTATAITAPIPSPQGAVSEFDLDPSTRRAVLMLPIRALLDYGCTSDARMKEVEQKLLACLAGLERPGPGSRVSPGKSKHSTPPSSRSVPNKSGKQSQVQDKGLIELLKVLGNDFTPTLPAKVPDPLHTDPHDKFEWIGRFVAVKYEKQHGGWCIGKVITHLNDPTDMETICGQVRVKNLELLYTFDGTRVCHALVSDNCGNHDYVRLSRIGTWVLLQEKPLSSPLPSGGTTTVQGPHVTTNIGRSRGKRLMPFAGPTSARAKTKRP
jgi:hypothetical protein